MTEQPTEQPSTQKTVKNTTQPQARDRFTLILEYKLFLMLKTLLWLWQVDQPIQSLELQVYVCLLSLVVCFLSCVQDPRFIFKSLHSKSCLTSYDWYLVLLKLDNNQSLFFSFFFLESISCHFLSPLFRTKLSKPLFCNYSEHL